MKKDGKQKERERDGKINKEEKRYIDGIKKEDRERQKEQIN